MVVKNVEYGIMSKYCWCNNCGKYEENCICEEPDYEYC